MTPVTMEIRPRETVVLAQDYSALVAWYRDVLGFREVRRFEDGFHYCNLETASGIRIGIGAADEMGVVPTDRRQNTVVLQFEVENVEAFFARIERSGGTITFGPTLNEKDGYWFGAIADPEGNPCWVVDGQCP